MPPVPESSNSVKTFFLCLENGFRCSDAGGKVWLLARSRVVIQPTEQLRTKRFSRIGVSAATEGCQQ